MTARLSTLALAALLPASVASAQDLLLDVETSLTLSKPVGSPREMTLVDGITYFAATQNTTGVGRELWRTDGTEAGTWLVADVEPDGSSAPLELVDFGDGTFFFTADTIAEGRELWRSDGTAAGTTLVADIFAGPESSTPSELTVFGGALYFFADGDNGAGRELWTSDGTPGGTQFVADLFTGPFGHDGRLIATGSHLFVAARTPGSSSNFTLYSTTGAGLTQLFVGPWGLILDSLDFVPFGADLLYFRGDAKPWISDGTPAGTHAICDCEFAQNAAAADDHVFFSASTPATGLELWVTDGSEAGTSLLVDLDPGTPGGTLGMRPLRVAPNEIVFNGRRPDVGKELFRATPTSVELVADFLPGPGSSAAQPIATLGAGYTVWVQELARSVWATDGPDANLVKVLDLLDTTSGIVIDAVDLGGVQLMSAAVSSGGQSLYRTDATPAGTQLVADIELHPTSGSSPSHFTTVGDKTFFFASTQATGRELWVTDGTTGGTQLVADLVPGPDDAVTFDAGLVAVGDRVVFVSDAGTFATPYASDGTAAGTVALAAPSAHVLSTDIDVLDGRAYFFHADALAGRQLWSSDGTSGGTAMVADISPGVNGVSGGEIAAVNGRIYFTPIVGGTGQEVWVTDGTAAGTQLLADVQPGSFSSIPTGFAPFGERVVFSADTPGVGRELWVSDGTPGGTSLALDVWPGSPDGEPGGFTAIGDDVLVFHAFDATVPSLYATDAAFSTVTALFPLPLSLPEPPLTALDDKALFLVPTGDDKGVWVTDGTLAGTQRPVDDAVVWPLGFLGRPGTDGRVLMRAYAPPYDTLNQELWVTDGTLAGTSQVPLELGSVSTLSTAQIERLGDQLVLRGESQLFGSEPFVLPLLATGAHVAEVIGGGCAGTGGVVPSVTTNGAAADGELFTVGLSGAAPNAPSYLAASTGVATLEGCALVPASPLLLLLATDGAGEITIPFVPDSSFVGLRIVLQWATLDPAGSFVNKASLSPALEVVFGP